MVVENAGKFGPKRFVAGLGGALGVALAVLVPQIAWAQGAAQSPNCPPGSWFCVDVPQAPPAAPATPPAPPASAQQPPVVVTQPAPPPVIVYQPPPQITVVQAPPPPRPNARPADEPPPYVYTPRPAAAYPKPNEWSIGGFLAGASFGKGRENNAGMGGIGAGVRYKPVPSLGVQGDLGFFGGRDYTGMKRTETALMLSALMFVNPKDTFQVFFLAGFGWSGAHVTDDRKGTDAATYDYGYFGAHLGGGVEWRISRHFALDADLRGFIRGRIDDRAVNNYEFRDANGRMTNSSGGGLVSLAALIYF